MSYAGKGDENGGEGHAQGGWIDEVIVTGLVVDELPMCSVRGK